MYDGSLYLEVVRGQRSPYTPGMDRKDDLSPADTESSETLHRSTHTMNATYDNNPGIYYLDSDLLALQSGG